MLQEINPMYCILSPVLDYTFNWQIWFWNPLLVDSVSRETLNDEFVEINKAFLFKFQFLPFSSFLKGVCSRLLSYFSSWSFPKPQVLAVGRVTSFASKSPLVSARPASVSKSSSSEMNHRSFEAVMVWSLWFVMSWVVTSTSCCQNLAQQFVNPPGQFVLPLSVSTFPLFWPPDHMRSPLGVAFQLV